MTTLEAMVACMTILVVEGQTGAIASGMDTTKTKMLHTMASMAEEEEVREMFIIMTYLVLI